MYRSAERFCGYLGTAGLLGVCFAGMVFAAPSGTANSGVSGAEQEILETAQPADPEPSAAEETVRICDPDEYVVIPSETNKNRIYDDQGRLVGTIDAYLGEYTPVVYDRDSIVTGYDDDTQWIYTLEDQRLIAEFPSDGTQVTIHDSVFLVTERDAQRTCLYDRNGTCLYEMTIPFASDEWGYGCELVSTAGGYLLIVTGQEQNLGIWVSSDGAVQKEITSPLVQEVIAKQPYSILPFGEYLYASDYDTRLGKVFDLDGTVYLDSLAGGVWDYTNMSYWTWNGLSLSHVYKAVDGIYVVYDTSLNAAAQVWMSDVTDEYEPFRTENGYTKGMPLEVLENRICSELLTYNQDEARPYARNQNVFYIYDGERLDTWELYHEELPEQMNPRYLLTTQASQNGNTIYRLRDRSTHEIVWETPDDGSYYSFSLLEDSIYYYSYEDENMRNEIYDNDRNLLFSSEHSYISRWQKGLYYGSRGIYSGIMKADGSWVIRNIWYEE